MLGDNELGTYLRVIDEHGQELVWSAIYSAKLAMLDVVCSTPEDWTETLECVERMVRLVLLRQVTAGEWARYGILCPEQLGEPRVDAERRLENGRPTIHVTVALPAFVRVDSVGGVVAN